MYLRVRDIDSALFFYFSVGISNCSDSVVLLSFILFLQLKLDINRIMLIKFPFHWIVFIVMWLLLTRKLMNQRFLVVELKSSLWKYIAVATMTWIIATEYPCHKWQRIYSVSRYRNPFLSSFMTYHMIVDKSNTTVLHVRQQLLTLPEHLSLPLVLNGVRVVQSSV